MTATLVLVRYGEFLTHYRDEAELAAHAKTSGFEVREERREFSGGVAIRRLAYRGKDYLGDIMEVTQ